MIKDSKIEKIEWKGNLICIKTQTIQKTRRKWVSNKDIWLSRGENGHYEMWKVGHSAAWTWEEIIICFFLDIQCVLMLHLSLFIKSLRLLRKSMMTKNHSTLHANVYLFQSNLILIPLKSCFSFLKCLIGPIWLSLERSLIIVII